MYKTIDKATVEQVNIEALLRTGYGFLLNLKNLDDVVESQATFMLAWQMTYSMCYVIVDCINRLLDSRVSSLREEVHDICALASEKGIFALEDNNLIKILSFLQQVCLSLQISYSKGYTALEEAFDDLRLDMPEIMADIIYTAHRKHISDLYDY